MIAKNEKTKPLHCAIYTRKSHEEGLEQEFNSLDAQRESCEAYTASQKHEGWKALATHYDDGGFTGGNMDRPGLKALLADIEAGGVDVVMVYKVDRLSRSLMDFSKLVALFEEHDVAFVSVTQHFDTTSSMGRLTLNILLSFAQFERELCGERIRDKIASAKRKGKYVGGRPLLGYDVDRERMRLLVNETEAKLVRHVFDRFCRLGSCMLVARELNEQGHRMKAWVTKKGKPMGGGMWKKTDVHHLLTNRRYLGEVMYKGESYDGEHDAIVDRKVWDRVRAILSGNRTVRANQTRSKTSAVLKGLIRCECCDAAMAPTYTTRRGKRYHYYVCHAAAKKGYDTCDVRSVPAGQIEQAVFTYLQEIFADPAMVARTFRAAGDKDDGPLADELRKLNDEYTDIEAQVQQIEAQLDQQEDVPSERDVAEALRTVEPLWAELFPAEKERIVRLLVETVSVRPDGLTIRLRPTGLIALAAEVAPQESEECQPQEATA
jgi:site-specific DNA recombinase